MKRFFAGCAVITGLMGFTAPAWAANTLPAGCGSETVLYKVKTEKLQASLENAPADKAQIIFLATLDGGFASGPISRFAVDGNWLGATKGNSFFVVNVAPGAHQICASRQSASRLERDNVGSLNVQWQAGQTYIYRFTIKRTAIGDAQMRANGAGVPGSSMTAKDPDTVDSATLSPEVGAPAAALLNKVPKAVATVK